MSVNWMLEKCILISICFHSSIGITEAVTWKGPEQEVRFYSTYASVSPVRFSLPSNLKEATWSFRSTKKPTSCDDRMISIFLQYGSLPVVNPLNELYPERFYLRPDIIKELKVNSDNISVSHTQLFPRAGDWYAVALIPEKKTAIQQKGLTTECKYNFTSSLVTKALPSFQHVSVNQETSVHLTGGDGVWVGFTAPESSFSIKTTATITNCSVPPCVLELTGFNDSTNVTDSCNINGMPCQVNFSTPLLGANHFLFMKLGPADANATVSLSVQSEDCSPAESGKDSNSNSLNSTCLLEGQLDRYEAPRTRFVRLYNDSVHRVELTVTDTSVTVIPFVLETVTDIGGTMNVNISFKRADMLNQTQKTRVCGQLTSGRFPAAVTSDLDLCTNDTSTLQANSTSTWDDGKVSGKLYVPYPEAGTWLLSLHLQCYKFDNGSVEVVQCENGTQKVSVEAGISDCVDGGCSGHGNCRKNLVMGPDFVIVDTCNCVAGWRGYGCTDGREAMSDEAQLIEVLLLTMSNLFFIPAIVVAAYRRHNVEAIVYFYNMFFSTFYHACDGERTEKFKYCMTDYWVMAYCDFLASTCALWVTLVAMAQLPVDYGAALQMAGPLALIVGILLDRHSLWVIAVPGVIGFLIVIVSWTLRCCNMRRCFPSKVRYLWMLPGFLFAGAGGLIFAFFQTDQNYKYFHSAWHVCLSLSIIFLLPPRNKKKHSYRLVATRTHNGVPSVVTSVNFDDTESTEGLVLGPNSYSRRMNFEL